MSVYFNELTLDQIPAQNFQLLKQFWPVWSKFVKATDKKVKYMLLPDSAMARLSEVVTSSQNSELQQFFFTFFKPKFRVAPDDESASNAEANDQFNGSEYSIVVDETSQECQSLGWAAINNSITLGFSSSQFWRRISYEIMEDSLDHGMRQLRVLCISELDHIDDKRVQTWIAVNREFENVAELVPCLLPIEQRIQPRFNVPHHENEKLKAFSNKIVRHRYVEGVVDTLPFDSTTSRFILRCDKDGIVDVRLHWTETGCGLRIKTTGRGRLQTEKIAHMLEDEYDKKS